MNIETIKNIGRGSPDAIKKKTIDFTDDIVVIDDDQDDRHNLCSLFEDIDPDQNLRFFKNGDQFLNYIQGQDLFWSSDCQLGLPKIILIDMNMPIRDGVSTLSSIRSNPQWCDVPVILVTGTDDDKKIEQAYNLGANAFISKPFHKLDLIQAIYRGFNYTPTLI